MQVSQLFCHTQNVKQYVFAGACMTVCQPGTYDRAPPRWVTLLFCAADIRLSTSLNLSLFLRKLTSAIFSRICMLVQDVMGRCEPYSQWIPRT